MSGLVQFLTFLFFCVIGELIKPRKNTSMPAVHGGHSLEQEYRDTYKFAGYGTFFESIVLTY